MKRKIFAAIMVVIAFIAATKLENILTEKELFYTKLGTFDYANFVDEEGVCHTYRVPGAAGIEVWKNPDADMYKVIDKMYGDVYHHVTELEVAKYEIWS